MNPVSEKISRRRMRKIRPIAERFWGKVQTGLAEECWPWTGCTRGRDDPYGAFGIPGGQYRAHRVAYELTIGPIQGGMVICHNCDNPKCCNPAHLFMGTPQENDADRVAKERQARGSGNGASRLTVEDVDAIRLLRAGKHKPRYIARAFGITPAYVWELCTPQRAWRHL